MDSLTRQFIKEMERKILTGYWEIGEKIPPLRTLADEFHVSRSVINAGIAELSNDGYLITVPRKHIIVADWKKAGKFAQLNGLIENELCDYGFFDELLEGRKTIEIAVVKRASKFRTEEDLRTLKDIIEKEKRTTLVDERTKLDVEFHQALAVSAHNLLYVVILNSFNSVAFKMTREFYEKGIDAEFVVAMHEKLYQVIKEKNEEEGEKVIKKILDHGEEELKK